MRACSATVPAKARMPFVGMPILGCRVASVTLKSVRFVFCFKPARNSSLSKSTTLQWGRVAVSFKFARSLQFALSHSATQVNTGGYSFLTPKARRSR